METAPTKPRVQLVAIREPQPVRRVRGLDGMRALACAAVLAYHLLPGHVVGGFLGVDVFFVLSGFLITALLVREWDTRGHIDVHAFWLRRVRRLAPAVTFMTVATLVVAGITAPDLLAGITSQFFGALFFVYNWVEIALGASYFDTANPHLWTNVWSLAVEQQFYLIWPLVMGVILALPRRFRWLVPLGAAATSCAWMAHLIAGASDYTRAYQGTDSHAFGLMVGALLAIAAARPLSHHETTSKPVVAYLRGTIAWLGFGAVIAGWFVIADTAAWTYPWGTLAECVAMLALMQGFLPRVDQAPGPGRWLASLLDVRPLAWLGERSYGIYLWHWPLLVIINHHFPQLSLVWSAAIITAASVLIAALSYRLIEVPMRFRGIGRTLRCWFGPKLLVATKSAELREARWFDLARISATGVAMTAAIAMIAMLLVKAPTQTSAQRFVAAGATALTTPTPSASPSASPTPSASPSTSPTPSASPTPSVKPTPGPQVPPAGEHVSVIGDSVTVAASSALQQQLPGVAIDAAVSRSIIAGLQIVRDQLAAGTLRPYVVIALAANSYMTADNIAELLHLIGPQRRLILVTGYGPQRLTWIHESNAAIHAALTDKTIALADWEAAIAPHPELLAGDAVHPGAEGAQIYAHVVKKALAKYH